MIGGAPRAVHPGAWWLWAIGLATAASRTTNPLLLVLVLAVVWHVVVSRRSDAPWARAFALFLKLGLVVIVIRVVAQTIFGAAGSGVVLFRLPEVSLPAWAAGVTLGGPVTLDTMMAAVIDGMRLATMLACIGAANALANPKRLLASLPAALYEIGVAVVVALSFAPSMVISAQRIRAARRLRGRASKGLRGVASVAMPVLEDALERSLALAAAMDSRGYGRRATLTATTRRMAATLTLVGLGGTAVGIYALLDGTGPAAVGVGVLVGGLVVAAGGLALSGRRSVRSRYRPDPWRGPEWIVAASGVAAATGAIMSGMADPASMRPGPGALATLSLPVLAAAGVLVAALPAWTTPRPPSSLGTAGRMHTDPEQAHRPAGHRENGAGHTDDVTRTTTTTAADELERGRGTKAGA